MSIPNLTNETLGQFQLREPLGFGGMAVVYRAYQSNLKREVAVKVLSPNLALHQGYTERFNREAETAAHLEHPHIVPVYDYGTQRGTSYIAMRLLNGGTLAQRLAQRAGGSGALPSLGEIASLLNQLASALDYAHSENVIHRDIKTSNVMFDERGNAYLMDFGIARLTEATSSLTGTGMAMGTPSYMPPEQWRGEELTPAADQYALGIMIYALVSGRLPFEAGTPYALMHKHINDTPTPPHAFRVNVPETVSIVLNRAMAKDPLQRFPTVSAFARAFENAVKGNEGEAVGFFTFKVRAGTVGTQFTPSKPSTAHPLPVVDKRKGGSTLLLLIGGAAALVVVGLIVLSALQSSDSDLGMRQTRVALNLTETALVSASASATATRGFITILNTETPGVTPEPPTSTPTPEPTLPAVIIVPTNEPTLVASEAPTQTTVDEALAEATEEEQRALVIPSTETPTETLTPTPVPTNTPQPTATMTAVPTETPSDTPQPTKTLTLTPSFTPTKTSTQTLTPTYTATMLPTLTLTWTPTFTDTPAPTLTPSPVPTDTAQPSPTYTNTVLPTPTLTQTPTDTPIPTVTPSPMPTDTPLPTPTFSPVPTDTPAPSATLSPCRRSDVNGNGTVDIFDVRPVAALLGRTSVDADFNAGYDFDEDGDIDIFDLRRVSSQYGQTCN